MSTTTILFICAILTTASLGGNPGQSRFLRSQKIFPSGRIVGGIDTNLTEIPYQVQVEQLGVQSCGGSILSENYVLTAAHCTYGASAPIMTVRYGTNKLNADGTVIQVAKISQHYFFSLLTLDYDVSVLKLKEPIIFSDIAQPITLASKEPHENASALVSGWGRLVENGDQPEQLQSVVIPVMGFYECYNIYDGFEITVTERMICAGEFGKAPCQGDSGGALVTDGVQSGIVSWSVGCAREGYPAVFSNVAALRGFIDQSTNGTARWA